MSSIFFQAVGKPIFAVLTSLIRDIVCFIPLICIMPIFMGIDGILWSAPIADAIAMSVTAVLTVVYFVKLNKLGNDGSNSDLSADKNTPDRQPKENTRIPNAN